MNLDLDPRSPLPLYQQILDGIRRLVAIGALRPGDRVPAVRDLAIQLRVNRNTAARAIQELEARGLVRTRVGQGTFIAEKARQAGEASQEGLLGEAFSRLVAEAEALGVPPGQLPQRLKRFVQNEGLDGRGMTRGREGR